MTAQNRLQRATDDDFSRTEATDLLKTKDRPRDRTQTRTHLGKKRRVKSQIGTRWRRRLQFTIHNSDRHPKRRVTLPVVILNGAKRSEESLFSALSSGQGARCEREIMTAQNRLQPATDDDFCRTEATDLLKTKDRPWDRTQYEPISATRRRSRRFDLKTNVNRHSGAEHLLQQMGDLQVGPF